MYGESNMETYITICKIDNQWEFAVWLRKPKQGLNLEGWDGEGNGREVQERRDICIPSTPGLLPGKSHGQRSLVGYSPWGRKESDTTERLHFTRLILVEV